MRYFIRAVKYFVQLMVILAIIIAILIVAKVVDSDISKIFVNGYDSLWQIALMMAAFAALYPRFGYSSRQAIMPGSDEEIAPELDKVMNAFGYGKEHAVADRVFRMWEDRITVTRFVSGYELEGPGKDVVRLVNALRDA